MSGWHNWGDDRHSSWTNDWEAKPSSNGAVDDWDSWAADDSFAGDADVKMTKPEKKNSLATLQPKGSSPAPNLSKAKATAKAVAADGSTMIAAPKLMPKGSGLGQMPKGGAKASLPQPLGKAPLSGKLAWVPAKGGASSPIEDEDTAPLQAKAAPTSKASLPTPAWKREYVAPTKPQAEATFSELEQQLQKQQQEQQAAKIAELEEELRQADARSAELQQQVENMQGADARSAQLEQQLNEMQGRLQEEHTRGQLQAQQSMQGSHQELTQLRQQVQQLPQVQQQAAQLQQQMQQLTQQLQQTQMRASNDAQGKAEELRIAMQRATTYEEEVARQTRTAQEMQRRAQDAEAKSNMLEQSLAQLKACAQNAEAALTKHADAVSQAERRAKEAEARLVPLQQELEASAQRANALETRCIGAEKDMETAIQAVAKSRKLVENAENRATGFEQEAIRLRNAAAPTQTALAVALQLSDEAVAAANLAAARVRQAAETAGASVSADLTKRQRTA